MMPFRFTVRVFLVDIAPAYADRLTAMIASVPHMVLLQPDTPEIVPLAFVEASVPEIVVVDVNGAHWQQKCELIQQIRALSPHTQVIVITKKTAPKRTFAALQAGALGYVDVNNLAGAMLPAMHAALHESGFLDPTIAVFILQACSQAEQTELTAREYAILRAFARGELAAEVREHLHLQNGDLERHIGNIFLKIAIPASEFTKSQAYRITATARLQEPAPLPRRQRPVARWVLKAFFRATTMMDDEGLYATLADRERFPRFLQMFPPFILH